MNTQHKIDNFKEFWVDEVRKDREFDLHFSADVDGKPFEGDYFYTGAFLKSRDEQRKFPAIVCRCGNSSFQAAYGTYCLDLRCIACGATETVYDG